MSHLNYFPVKEHIGMVRLGQFKLALIGPDCNNH